MPAKIEFAPQAFSRAFLYTLCFKPFFAGSFCSPLPSALLRPISEYTYSEDYELEENDDLWNLELEEVDDSEDSGVEEEDYGLEEEEDYGLGEVYSEARSQSAAYAMQNKRPKICKSTCFVSCLFDTIFLMIHLFLKVCD